MICDISGLVIYEGKSHRNGLGCRFQCNKVFNAVLNGKKTSALYHLRVLKKLLQEPLRQDVLDAGHRDYDDLKKIISEM